MNPIFEDTFPFLYYDRMVKNVVLDFANSVSPVGRIEIGIRKGKLKMLGQGCL